MKPNRIEMLRELGFGPRLQPTTVCICLKIFLVDRSYWGLSPKAFNQWENSLTLRRIRLKGWSKYGLVFNRWSSHLFKLRSIA